MYILPCLVLHLVQVHLTLSNALALNAKQGKAKCQSNWLFNCVKKKWMESYFQQTHTLTPTAPYGVRAVLDAKETFESKR